MNQRGTLVGIQYLRGIAALMVAYFHLAVQSAQFNLPRADHLTGGVDIFFVISGFIMVVTSGKLSAGEFAWRRIMRIVPLYWVLTAAVFALGAVGTLRGHPLHHSLGELWRSLLFVPYPQSDGSIMPMIHPGWSLNIEMYFYALFALTMLPAVRKYQLAILGALFGALVLIQSRNTLDPITAFYMQPRLLEFWAGMALGSMYLRGWLRLPPYAAIALVIAAVGAMFLPSASWLAIGIALVGGIVCVENAHRLPQAFALKALGDASYSLYLTHVLTINAVYVLMSRLHRTGTLMSVAFFCISAIVIMIVGLASYHFIERPLLHRITERHVRPGRYALSS